MRLTRYKLGPGKQLSTLVSQSHQFWLKQEWAQNLEGVPLDDVTDVVHDDTTGGQ